MKRSSKLCALACTLALALTLLPASAAAAGGTQLTITPTTIQAESVANYDGYGGIAVSAGVDEYFGVETYRSALIDTQGNFIFPYADNLYPFTTFQYICSDGYALIDYGNDVALDIGYLENPTYYNLDGTPADIPLPDADKQSFIESYNADDARLSYTLHPFYDGVALVEVQYDTVYLPDPNQTAGGGSGVGNAQMYMAYLIDTQGNVLATLGEDIYQPLFYMTASPYADIGAAGEGLVPYIFQEVNDVGFYISRLGYLDYSGQLALDLTDTTYRDLGTFSEGLAWVVDDAAGKCGYIDKTGQLVIPLEYDTVYPFSDGMAVVRQGDKWGAIDQNNNVVIPFQYDGSFGGTDGYMTVQVNGKYGLVDKENQMVVPAEYDDISTFENGAAYALKDGYVHIITEGTAAPIAYASTQTVTIDGAPVELPAYALLDENGYATNYVKLRDVASLLNGTAAQFEVGWDGNVNIITGQPYTPNGTELSTPFSGDRTYTTPTSATNVNGAAADLDAIVLTDDSGGGYTYYQLRDLGRTLGFNVGWSAEQGIYIETDKPYSEAD